MSLHKMIPRKTSRLWRDMAHGLLIAGILVLIAGQALYAQKLPVFEGGLTEADSISFSREFFNGLKSKTLGDIERAVRSFSACTEINPGSDAAWYELAILYTGKKDPGKALEAIRKAIDLNDTLVWYWRLNAELLRKKKLYEESLQAFEQLIRLEPSHTEHYYNKANTLLRLSRPAEALQIYEQIEEMDGPSTELTLHRQEAYLQAGDVNKAIEDVNELISEHPGEVRFRLMLGELYDAESKSRKAFNAYKEALDIEPDNGYALLALADHYHIKGEQEASYQELKKAFITPDLNMDTKIRILLNNYIKKRSNGKSWEQAEELAEIVIADYPAEAKAHAVYGDLLLQQDKYTEARDAYREAVKYDQETLLLWEQLLNLEINLGDFRGLEAESTEAIRYFPDKDDFYLLNGIAKIQNKRHKEAIATLKVGLSITDKKEKKIQFYANLGDAYHALGEHRNSDDSYKNALQLDPDNSLVLNNYAYYLSVREEELGKAERMARKVVELEPGVPAYLDTYAWVLFKAGKADQARKWIEKALQAEPSNPEFLEHYGDILFRLNEKTLAVEMWNKAREMGSNSSRLKEKIEENQ